MSSRHIIQLCHFKDECTAPGTFLARLKRFACVILFLHLREVATFLRSRTTINCENYIVGPTY